MAAIPRSGAYRGSRGGVCAGLRGRVKQKSRDWTMAMEGPRGFGAELEVRVRIEKRILVE